MPQQNSSRNQMLRAIHTAARAQGLITTTDRSVYEDMLWTVARVRSAKDLDAHGLNTVLNHLNGKPTTWQPAFKAGTQQALMAWIWSCLHKASIIEVGSVSALRKWARSYETTELEFCDEGQLNRLIAMLKEWSASTGVKWR